MVDTAVLVATHEKLIRFRGSMRGGQMGAAMVKMGCVGWERAQGKMGKV